MTVARRGGWMERGAAGPMDGGAGGTDAQNVGADAVEPRLSGASARLPG